MEARVKFRESRFLAGELQPSFGFVRTRTGVAVLHEDRLDLMGKVNHPFRSRRLLRTDHRSVNSCDHDKKTFSEPS